MKHRGRVGLVLLVVVWSVTAVAGAAVGPVAAASAPTGDSTTAMDDATVTAIPGDGPAAHEAAHVNVSQELRRQQQSPGNIRVRQTFEIPSDMLDFRTFVPSGASSVSFQGFNAMSGGGYQWDRETSNPTLQYTLSVDESGSASGPNNAGGSTLFKDTGDWAIVRVPPVEWEGSSDSGTATLDTHTHVYGPGAVGEQTAYLGPHQEYNRTTNGQTVRLIVPDAASMGPAPGDVLRTFSGAASGVDIGNAADSVFVVAAPTSVDWAGRGYNVGNSDLWVQADEPISEPRNAWITQYAEGRLDMPTASETDWLSDAIPYYYGTLLTLQQGRINYTTTVNWLGRGEQNQYTDVELRDRSSWHDQASYRKGGLALANLDKLIRQETGGDRTLTDVLRQLNGQPGELEQSTLLATIEQVAGTTVRSQAKLLTESTNNPEMWSQDDYEQYFKGTGSEFEYRVPAPGTPGEYEIRGPYRNETVDAQDFNLVAGERLAVDVEIENVGHQVGEYNLRALEDSLPLLTRQASLKPGEITTESVEIQLNETGDRTILLGGQELSVTVSEPAAPTVTNLTVNRSSIAASESVQLTATVTNEADRSAGGSLLLNRSGSTIATLNATLAPGETVTFNVTDQPEAGSHEYTVGGQSVSVDVTGDEQTPGDGGGGGGGDSDGGLAPGFGPIAAALGVIGAVFLLRRRRA